MKNCPKCKERKHITLDNGRSTLKKKLLSAAGGQLLKCQSCGAEFSYFGRLPVTPVPSAAVETSAGHPSGDPSKEEYGELIRQIEQAELTSGLLVPVQEQAPDGGAVIDREDVSEAVKEEPSHDTVEVPSMMTKTLELEVDAVEIHPETSAGEEEHPAPEISQESVLSEIRDEVDEVEQEELPLPHSELEFEKTDQPEEIEQDVPWVEPAPAVARSEEEDLIETEPTLTGPPPEPEQQKAAEETEALPVRENQEETSSSEPLPLTPESENLPKPPARPRTLQNYDSLALFPRRREPEKKGSE